MSSFGFIIIFTNEHSIRLIMKYIKITFLFILSILSSSLALEAQSDSATSNKSYFKFSGTYLSNFIYNGRQVYQPPINWTNLEKQFDCFVCSDSRI